MSSGHIPVLLPEVLEALAPLSGARVIDGTFGGGGYSRALLAAGAIVTGIDRDPQAVARGRELASEVAGRFAMVEDTFSRLDTVLEAGTADGVVLDVGVSSYQIDTAERGFSFQKDGPLDMRMGAHGPSAADVVAQLTEAELTRLFQVYGEEREARRIARAIVQDRTGTPFTTTLELAGLVSRVAGRGPPGPIHPATRVFQALRIYVNDELGELQLALAAAERALAPGGRLVVVAFHSLEDRIVKGFLAERGQQGPGSRHMPAVSGPAPTFDTAGRKAVPPTDDEVAANPRARSARLRSAIRTEAPARSRPVNRPEGVPPLDEVSRRIVRKVRTGGG